MAACDADRRQEQELLAVRAVIVGVMLSVVGVLFAPSPGVSSTTVIDNLRAAGTVSESILASLEHMQVPDGAYLNDPGGLRAQRRREGDSFAPMCGIQIWDWTCPGFAGGPPGGADSHGADLPAPDSPLSPDVPGTPAAPLPVSCDPLAPKRPKPDVAAVHWPLGEIVHQVGSGRVATGMDTEFTWTGPDQVSWTQTGQPGVAADCSLLSAPVVEFTAHLRNLVFDFEGERRATTTGTVRYVYETAGPHEVVVTGEWTIPGTGFVASAPAAELVHRVIEIRSTLQR